MNKISDRRKFDRFPMDYILEVFFWDMNGKKIEDTVVSKEFSGEGATFLTQKAGIYFLGQSLELTVFLPETDAMKACMKAKATVLRIEPFQDSINTSENRDCTIAVEFKAGLKFECIDKKSWETKQ